MLLSHFRFLTCLLLVGLPMATLFAADPPPEAEPKLPTIADEPKSIDPATVMPPKLAVSATVDLSESSLREVLEWLRTEQNLVVLLEQNALPDARVLLGEPISDRLDDAPVYLLLNRLRALGLAWYYEDDILHVTSAEAAEERLTTITYNVGDLLDAGYEADGLADVIVVAIDPDSWDDVGGPGALSLLGDIMFVRQSDAIHRKVQGLLAALRQHGRQTLTLDPPQHLVLRQKLDENVSVDFVDTPLDAAVKQIGDQMKVDIRLDLPALRDLRIRERQPVTLKLADRKLKTVLQALIAEYELTWILRDGVLWITSLASAEEFQQTAVYDVRDLSRDDSESAALRDAVISQTPSVWDEVGGPASIQFAKPGTLVVSGQEDLLMEVLTLLERYRTALRASKPRDRDIVDPNEVYTVYYRLHANVAEDLATLIPKLVKPDSWKSDAVPGQPGEILRAASPPDLFSAQGQLVMSAAKGDAASTPAVVVARAVLIIRQTRAAHEEIEKVIRRVEGGDVWEHGGAGPGMGGMGGGFGGGFFSVPSVRPRK